ncbi:hypothetical protein BDW74DRAFT_145383 [Aspergillus multicolor]|uniref:uncharacterized protein n=1 Tax=Aspergillus multicolor TaxID=41759 RepID=UPI003CCD786E
MYIPTALVPISLLSCSLSCKAPLKPSVAARMAPRIITPMVAAMVAAMTAPMVTPVPAQGTVPSAGGTTARTTYTAVPALHCGRVKRQP